MFDKILEFLGWADKPVPPTAPPEQRGSLRRAVNRAQQTTSPQIKYPVQAPVLPAGVVPKGSNAPVMAMDNAYGIGYGYADLNNMFATGFPGYPYLANLAMRAEYRAFASSLSTEITREGITITSSETSGDKTKDKVTKLTKKFDELRVMQIIKKAAEHDCYYGRGQIFIDLGVDELRAKVPLVLSPKTIGIDSLKGFRNVEPMWTTPSAYNAIDPTKADFYKPRGWFMLGKEVHASRLITIITQEVADMLKPAFNFSGISMSQRAEPYVNNWLRTRQAVSDIIDNFSTTVLKTDMGSTIQGDDDGSGLMDRADLFTATRSNKGLMILDKEREELEQINTPLGNLDKLQAQSQEQMCSVSHIPAVILTGLSPGGLNASSEGEIKVFYDWIAALQMSDYRVPILTMLSVVQLSMFGEIDPDISFIFNPLYQMTPKELAEIRAADATADMNYVSMGAISADDVREKLARDPESGYHGLSLNVDIEDTEDDEEDLT